MTHTPGPWMINGGPNPLKPQYATIYVKPGDHTTVDHICTIGQHHSTNWQDNAHLITSAPALLEALKHCIEWLDRTGESMSGGGKEYDYVTMARKAINKAEGKG